MSFKILTFIIFLVSLANPVYAKNSINNKTKSTKIKSDEDKGQSDKINKPAFSIGVVPIYIPLLGSNYQDFQLLGEFFITEKHSLILNINYKFSIVYDSKNPGEKKGKGMKLAYRYHFDRENIKDLFIELGGNFLKAEVKQRHTNNTIKDNLISGIALVGINRKWTNYFHHEFALGIKFREKGITVDNYRGFQEGLRPQMHYALRFSF